MRHVKRLARPTRPSARGADRRDAAGCGACGASASSLLALGSPSAWAPARFLRSSVAERWASAVRRDLVAASVDAGFVVTRVYSEGRVARRRGCPHES